MYWLCNIDGSIDSWAKFQVERVVSRALQENQKTLPIFINSSGGSVYVMRSILDLLKGSGLELITINTGICMSAAVPIFAMGNKRFAYPSSRFMIHEVRRFPMLPEMQKTSDLKALSEEFDKLTEDMYKDLDLRCNKPKGYFKDLVYKKGNADLFMSSDEALKDGLVTMIKIPEKKDIMDTKDLSLGSSSDFAYMINECNAILKAEYETYKKDNIELNTLGINENISPDFVLNSNISTNDKENHKSNILNKDNKKSSKGGSMNEEEIKALLQAELKKQEEILNKGFESFLKENEEKMRKEISESIKSSYEDKINLLSSDLASLNAQNIDAKLEAEKARINAFLLQLKTEGRITEAEREYEKTFILKLEGEIKAEYMDKLAKKPINKANISAPLMSANENGINFNNKERLALQSGIDRNYVMASAEIRNNLSQKPNKTISDLKEELRTAVDKFGLNLLPRAGNRN